MATLLYDADCGFCRWSAAKVAAWDRAGRVRCVALQDHGEADRLLGAMPEAERMASWHFVLPGGAVRSAGAAFAPLLRTLPGGRPLARVAEASPGLTDAAYRSVAARRSFLGRLVGEGARRRADARLRARRVS